VTEKINIVMEYVTMLVISLFIITFFFSTPAFGLVGWTPLTITIVIIVLSCLLFLMWYHFLYLKVNLKKTIKAKETWLFAIMLILWITLIIMTVYEDRWLI
jgi:hypothetical protein